MAQERLTDRTELASSPADGDLVHIVDVSDTTDNANGTSKKITIANLLANVQQTTGNKFVGDITLVSGYTYSAWQQNSVINGTTYSTYVADSSITLGAADGSNDRFDIIVFNSNGTFTVVAGTAAADPIIPTIDIDTQVIVRIIRVTAASSTESGVTQELVYDEDTGVTAEWNATTTANVNEASTEQAANGTKSIKFTSATTSDYVSLVDTSTHDGNLATQIKFKVYLPTSANYRFYVQVGNIIQVVQDGLYGFSSSTTASWQQIIIPASEFAGLSGLSAYDTIVITNGRNNTTYFIDQIYVVEGFDTGSSEHPNYTLNLDGSNLQLLKDGDINSIADLSGISGSSPLTTKGDIYTYSTVDARLPVGTNGQVLSADSAEATGLKWIDNSNTITYGTAITTSSTLSTQSGLNTIYPVTSSSAVVVTVPTATYSAGDVVNLERRGSGTVQIEGASGFSLYGVRNVDNEFFITYPYSSVSILFHSASAATIIGRLDTGGGNPALDAFGYIGTSETKDVVVTGSNFTNAVFTVTGATLNSYVIDNASQATLNITTSGASNFDVLQVDVFNGGVDASETYGIVVLDAQSYFKLDGNSTESIGSHTITNVSPGNHDYVTGKIGQAWRESPGTGTYIRIDDSADFQVGDGAGTDRSFSFMCWLLQADTTQDVMIDKRDGTGSNREFSISRGNNDLLVTLVSNGNTANKLQKRFTYANNTSTFDHICVTYDGSGTLSGIKLYVNKVENTTFADESTGTYSSMGDYTNYTCIGGIITPSGFAIRGGIDEVVWFIDTALSLSEIQNAYDLQNTQGKQFA